MANQNENELQGQKSVIANVRCVSECKRGAHLEWTQDNKRKTKNAPRGLAGEALANWFEAERAKLEGDSYEPKLTLFGKMKKLAKDKEPSLRKTTIYHYHAFLKPLEEFMELNNGEFDAFKFKDWLLGIKKYAKSTTRTFIGKAKCLLNELLERDEIEINYFKNFKLDFTVEPSDKHEPYNDTELETIKEHLYENEKELYILTTFIHAMAIRPYEVFQLTKDHIDCDNWLIKLPASISKNKKNFAILIPEYPRLREWLTAWKASCAKKLFVSSKQSLYKNYREILVKFEYDKKKHSIYAWKHTSAIRFYQRTKDIHLLKDFLGHSNILVTEMYLRRLNVLDVRPSAYSNLLWN